MTTARAFNERGDSVENPTSGDLNSLLRELTFANRFLVVERLDAENDEYYIQAYLRDDGAYWLEYRDGSADAHFRTSCRTLPVLAQIITMWLYRLPGWRETLPWTPWPGVVGT
ncbi:hypothetical protein [Spongiactinospora sp. TRM90649]|uniref:hypothetical protein n=1 Tax=Spongiactinospora sp. TRM90649 TaxID=3031114 RepID=UPI0023F90401|nr:hypothetical protein [Spongiactinospora sp. TRM90649]MDF5751803.1 hypothetical protein [Spongiactinospora sp. TRM90649]